MKTIYEYRKGVTKELEGSTHTLPILFEYAWSMLRVCLEYAYSMPRVCLEYAKSMAGVFLGHVFVRRERTLSPTCSDSQSVGHGLPGTLSLVDGSKMTRRWFEDGSKESRYIHGGNTEGPRSAMRVLRYAAILFLMMVVGVREVWGQTDYSGVYYIASDGNAAAIERNGSNKLVDEAYTYNASTPESNYYLVPACDPVQSDWKDAYNDGTTGNKPLLTTYKVGQENEPNWSEAVWVVRQVTDNDGTFYYIMHAETGKYVIYDPLFSGGDSRRKCMHLDETQPSNAGKFVIDEYEAGVYDIVPKSMRDNATTTHKFWNIADRNRNSRHGLDGEKYYGGMVGLFSYNTTTKKLDTNSRWKFEKVVPKVSSTVDDKVQLTFPVTSTTTKIHYTLDGSNPNSSSIQYSAPLPLPANSEDNMVVKAIAVVSDGDTPTPNTASSEVVTLLYKPDITLSQSAYTYNGGENKPTVTAVSIGTTTADVSAYSAPTYSEDVTNAGTPIITVTDANTTDTWYIWNASTTFTINQKEVGLTWTPDPATLTYNGVGQSPTATATGLIGSDPCTVTVDVSANSGSTLTGNDAINVGNYTATASALSNTNYKLPDERTQVFTINKASLTITANDNNITYGDAPTNDGVGYSGFVNGETESVLGGVLAYEYSYTQYGDVGNTYTITPSGLTSDNYDITFAPGTLTVNPKEVTVTSGITASDKTYDGTTTATLDCANAVFTGKIENDDLTLVSATGAFADKNVGTDKEVTITGLSFGGAAAGNYMLAETGNQSSIKASISAKDITASGTIAASNKVYDGTTTAVFDYSGVTLAGKVEGDNLSVTATGSFDDKYVGAGKTVTITGWALSGTDVGNYNLTGASISTTTTADITAKEITVSGITAENKVYNSTTTATLVYSGVTFTGMVEGDVLSVTATGAFADANIGTGKTVNISGLTLGGADSGNYTLAESGQQTETTANITAKAVTITANDASKEYDTTPLTESGFTVSALETGDTHEFTVVMTTGSTITNVGTTPNVIATVDGVAVTTGVETAVGNYLVTTVNGTLTIIGSNNIHITLTMAGWTYGNNPTNPNLTIAEYSANNATKTFYYKVKDAVDATYTTDKPTKTSSAGTYTVKVVVDPYESYNGGETTTDFTIAQAKLTITAQAKSKDYLDEDPVLTYIVSGLKNDEKQEDVLKVCNLQRESGEDVKDGGYAISINETNFTISSNYYRDFVSNVLTINPKNLGDGETSAPGIGIYAKKDGDSWTVSVYNGKNALRYNKTDLSKTDYTYAPDGNTITITAQGSNCTGSAKATYADATFYAIDGTTEKLTPYLSTTSDLTTSADLVPYIVANINPTIGTISIVPISYIPKDQPVLLLAPSDVSGITTSTKNPATPIISESLLNSNQLQVAPDVPSDPDDPTSVHGVHVENTEAYAFYKGEFVLTTAGTITAGKYYLYNPNYQPAASPSTPASPAPMRSLAIVKGETTGIIQLMNDEAVEGLNDAWYTIDGQKLDKKPTRKGLYIHNGKKHIVK